MKKFLKIAAFVLAAAMVLPMAGCSSKKDNVLRVGMECNYTPFNWEQADDSNGAVAIEGGGYAGGYDVEIAKKIAEGLGRELVIVKTTWGNLESFAKNGTVDCIISAMPGTMDRQDSLEFSNKYYTTNLTIVVKKDSAYANATSMEEISGIKVTSKDDSTHATITNQTQGLDKQANSKTYTEMITRLTEGTVDGFVADVASAKAIVALHPEFTYINFAEGKGFELEESYKAIRIGVKRNSKLLEKINEIVDGISVEEQENLMNAAIANQPK